MKGICVPYRCKDYSQTLGGILIGKNFSTVGQKATFKCKEGYFMPNLTNEYALQNYTSTPVVCTKMPHKLVPVSRHSSFTNELIS